MLGAEATKLLSRVIKASQQQRFASITEVLPDVHSLSQDPEVRMSASGMLEPADTLEISGQRKPNKKPSANPCARKPWPELNKR